MSFTSSAGITGPQAHPEALDAAANSRPNVNRTARKTGGATFSDLLNETIKKASHPTPAIGGAGPLQSNGLGIVGMSPNMSRGNIINTGNPLDLAVEGKGYFVLTDGRRDVYTRAGSFAVDANMNMVDPATGFRVKRIGSEGEIGGFQTPAHGEIRIPYDTTMPARATSEIAVSGNLSANAGFSAPQTQVITSSLAYTYDNGTTATEAIRINELDQHSGVLTSGTIGIGGYKQDGTAFNAGTTFAVDRSTTLGDLISHLNTNVLDGSTASLANGRIRITDSTAGYSKTDMTLSYSGDSSLATPAYFEISIPGGEESGNISITVYDPQGDKHVLSGAFVRAGAANTWDMILTSIAGDGDRISIPNRRIEGISFDAGNGSYMGLNGSNSAEFAIAFANDAANPQTIRLNPGTPGELDGLTQFAGNSTAAAKDQNGHGVGRLSTVSVNNEGTVVGAFSNGVRRNIGTIQVAMFKNAPALEHVGNGHYVPSAGSGEPVAGRAMTGGAGSIHNGALEKSNADVAVDFVNMLQTQNGFQANAETVKTANEILKELTSLIR